jgi:hypothetical protein
MNDPTPATLADYRAAVARFTDAIDAVLERGRNAEKRYEHLARLRDARPELHAAASGDLETLPPNQRHIQRRLLQLTENLYHTFLGPIPRPPAPLPRPASRALRHRI